MSGTSKLRLVPYTGHHFRRLWAEGHAGVLSKAACEASWLHAMLGPALTALEEPDGALVACAGIQIPHAGLGRAWALLGPLAHRYSLAVTRTVQRELAAWTLDHHLQRLEATVYAHDERNLRWAQALGFHVEHTMPAYGPHGETALLLVRLTV